jgi:hypothetical protein
VKCHSQKIADAPPRVPGHPREDAARRLVNLQHEVVARWGAAGQKKYIDTEPLLLAGYEGMKKREAKMSAQQKIRLTEALERLVQLYEAMDKKDDAAKWRKELEANKTAQNGALRRVPDGGKTR